MSARLLVAAVLALTALAPAGPAAAERDWAVTLLGGQYSGSKLLELGVELNFKDSYVAGLSVAYQFIDWGPHIRWEVEGQMLQHFGEGSAYGAGALALLATMAIAATTATAPPWAASPPSPPAPGAGR